MIFIFLTIIYFFALFFFGWQASRYCLKEDRIEYLLGLSGIVGMGLYLFLINGLGSFLPIKTVFYLVLILLVILGISLRYFNKTRPLRWELDKKWRKILLGVTLGIVVITGLIAFRMPLATGERLQGGGMPTAATMAEGNFPPLEIWEPPRPLVYHYAPELFAAATHQVAGLPLYLCYDLQKALLMGILFLLGFMLVKSFCPNNFKALVASLFMLYAGGLVFLNGLINGLFVLYQKYILHLDLIAPFKFIFEVFESSFLIPVFINVLDAPWVSWSLTLILTLIYLYFYNIEDKQKKAKVVLMGCLLSLLALNGEFYFVVFSVSLLIYPLIFGFVKKDWSKVKQFLIISCLILIIALPLAFIQGGVLKSFLGLNPKVSATEYYFGSQFNNAFQFNFKPWLLKDYSGKNNWLPVFDPRFLIEWGLFIILFIPAAVYSLKKYFQTNSFLLFLTVSFFCLPLFINFLPNFDNMDRFFFPVPLIGGLMIGLFLANLYFSDQRKWFRIALFVLVVIFAAQTLFFQLLYLTIGYPPKVWNAASQTFVSNNHLLAGRAYNWVKNNTTINDYFLILKQVDDDGTAALPNHKFVLNTGRLAPIYAYHWHDYQSGKPLPFFESILFQMVRRDCNSLALRELNYSYLYVNEQWPRELEEKCLSNNNLKLEFEISEGEKFVRIYRIIK